MYRLIEKLWYEGGLATWLLVPLEWLYRGAVAVRRQCYALGLFRVRKLSVPVIVVGNITAGGTGKTPLAIWLGQRLRRRGREPGIVSRGYGGQSATWPRRVMPDSDPGEVGDEALVLLRRSGCKVAVGPDRAAAAALLIEAGADVIVCDDGLQHLALARDVEIVVIDGLRRFGNGHCLPAGPLREPIGRIRHADVVVQNGGEAMFERAGQRAVPMQLRQLVAVPMTGGEPRRLADFRASPVHALAAIGHPERFFRRLEEAGLTITRHPYRDHAPLAMDDVLFMDEMPVLMTEKDAVKCQGFADKRHFFVPVTAEIRETDARRLLDVVDRVLSVAAETEDS